MATIEDLQKKYESLTNQKISMESEDSIDSSCLLCFDYEYPGKDAEVVIDTDEFTAGCPWTGMPDFGILKITYVPDTKCIELKALKYYLLSYRNVGIVQEHATNRILNDLVAVTNPIRMSVILDYRVRGGLHTVITASYERP